MNITEISIKLPDSEVVNNRLCAYVSVVFDNSFVVNEMKIVCVGGKIMLCMPSQKKRVRCSSCNTRITLGSRFCNECGQKQNPSDGKMQDAGSPYSDIAHPISAAFRRILEEKVISLYQEKLRERRSA